MLNNNFIIKIPINNPIMPPIISGSKKAIDFLKSLKRLENELIIFSYKPKEIAIADPLNPGTIIEKPNIIPINIFLIKPLKNILNHLVIKYIIKFKYLLC